MSMKKLSLLSALVISTTFAQEQHFITFGTGGQTGVYYVVGQSICKLVNRDTSKTGVKCNAPSTGGGVDNINALIVGERQLGIAQSDTQFRALEGVGEYEGKKFDKLRAVFSVHPEPFTVMVRTDANINGFSDLKGKRVNIGNPGSGTRTTMDLLVQAYGWDNKAFAVASELKPSEIAAALCDNNLDAISYTVGHPSGAIKEAAASCASHLINIEGEEVDALIAKYPYFSKATIPAGLYDGTEGETNTFGVYATVVSSSDVSDEAIYQITKAVFDNFDRFKRLHPAFEHLKPEDMISKGLSAPLHEGAKRYYKERGWLK